jgi:hypothetical protein
LQFTLLQKKWSQLSERILPSQEPTLPPIIVSSPPDDVIERRDSRREPAQFAQNERNSYDLVMPGTVETGAGLSLFLVPLISKFLVLLKVKQMIFVSYDIGKSF